MSNIAILGAVYGDEGKGRVVHEFSKNYDWIVRFNGGANAGHTIYRAGVKYVHNLMPSFDWRSAKPKAFLGAGMVIDLDQLLKEVTDLKKVNESFPSRVYVDPDAFLVSEGHKEQDKNSNGHIGSTNRGIGPAYKDKIGRIGLRIRDYMSAGVAHQSQVEEMKKMGVHFMGLMELQSDMEKSNILYEGAQGIMLDINHGTYPYVSCSDCTVAGIYAGGFHFAPPDTVYGVAKCYTTKVGEGPFPTEIIGKEADELRERGHEYGATTGRPRKVGWIDLPALNYACRKGGIHELILTKFDILNGMDQVNVCAAYDKPITCSKDFFSAKPQYITVPGWKDASVKEQLKPFIKIVEQISDRNVSHISFGTESKDMVRW